MNAGLWCLSVWSVAELCDRVSPLSSLWSLSALSMLRLKPPYRPAAAKRNTQYLFQQVFKTHTDSQRARWPWLYFVFHSDWPDGRREHRVEYKTTNQSTPGGGLRWCSWMTLTPFHPSAPGHVTGWRCHWSDSIYNQHATVMMWHFNLLFKVNNSFKIFCWLKLLYSLIRELCIGCYILLFKFITKLRAKIYM